MPEQTTHAVRAFGRFDGGWIEADTCLGCIALAAVVAIPVLHAPAALLFLLSGVLLLALRPARSIAAIYDARALLILPAFCVVSAIWSLYPALSLRHGIQLAATLVIAIVIARRAPLGPLIGTLFATLFALIAASIALGPYRADTGALVGLFGSKNEMAFFSVLLCLTSVSVVASPDAKRIVRLVGAAGACIGMGAVLLAQSVGALAYLPAGLIAFAAILVLRHVRPSIQIVSAMFLSLIALLPIIAIAAYPDDAAAHFLSLTGKDVMLTGRIDLWRVALNFIGERPALGLGFGAFWVPGHPPAEALWEIFGIQSRSGFNFHNAYLSNAVEIGWVGVAIQMAVIASSLVLTGRLAAVTGDRRVALLFAINAMVTTMTLLEAPVFFEFNVPTALMTMSIVFAADRLRSARTAPHRPPAGPSRRGVSREAG